MKKKICIKARSAAVAAAVTFLLFGLLYGSIPESFSRNGDGAAECFLCSVKENGDSAVSLSPYFETENSAVYSVGGDARLFGLIPVKSVNVRVYDNFKVTPGGMPFGVKINSRGLTVAGLCDVPGEKGPACPARDAGIEEGDVIKKAGGDEIGSSGELVSLVENSTGEIRLLLERDGKERNVSVRPVRSSADGKLKIGLLLRDGSAGIGTVTFMIPETGVFMGLGHGICDAETGERVEMTTGTVTDAVITGVTKGEPGEPGELKGTFADRRLGTVNENTDAGVLGILDELPKDGSPEGSTEIGLRDKVEVGEAYIWCTTGPEGPKKYSIKIERLPALPDGSSFEIRVTDPELIEKTGGIVQGMSGSPIIQNGKLVGAVTHVMVNDPERGYGIFIEKMLESVRDDGGDLQKSGNADAA